MKHGFPDICIYPELFPGVNVADLDLVEGAVGPGIRLGIWLQGCLKRCPGCINQLFLPVVPKHLFSIEELFDRLDAYPHLDGISLSGGEPVLQAKALIPFLQEVQHRNLSVVCYTGYRLEEVKAPGVSKQLKEFLSLVDILIDGEYRADLPRGYTYCASSNQRLNFLTNRIDPGELAVQPENALSFGQTQVKLTGTLPEQICFGLINKLKTYGIFLESDRQKEENNLNSKK